MATTLVVSLVAFFLAAGEATAAEQQLSQTSQQEGSSESTTVINGKVAEPVPEATKPPVDTPPVQKPPAKAPVPSPPPPPVESAPVAPEPDPAPQPPTAPRPTPQWFAVVIADGEEADDPDPVVTTPQPVSGSGGISKPETVPNASPGLVDLAPAPAAPAVEVDDGYASGPVPDPVLAVPGTTAPAAASPWAYSGGSPPPRPADGTPAKGSAPSVPAAPASSLGTTATGVMGTVQSAAASVASATTEVLGFLSGVLPSTSSNDPTDGSQEQQPSDGTPQPAPLPPLSSPGGGSAFYSSTGGGQMGSISGGGGFAPLVLDILALLAVFLLRRDFRTYLVSCEMPKPSSALLMPLERPG